MESSTYKACCPRSSAPALNTGYQPLHRQYNTLSDDSSNKIEKRKERERERDKSVEG